MTAPTDGRSPAWVFLYGQPWFDALPAPDKQTLVGAMTLKRAARGESLLHKGDAVDGWWGVLSGMAKLQTTGAEGKVSAFLGVPAGEWFGEGTVLRGGVWRYDVIAVRETTLIGMPLEHFQRLYRQDLGFNHYLIDRLNLRLGQAMTAIEAGRLLSAEERIAQYLWLFCGSGMRKLALSQEDLGQLAGLSRQTTNRVLKQFEAQGWVTLKFGRVEVVDQNALAAMQRTAAPS